MVATQTGSPNQQAARTVKQNRRGASRINVGETERWLSMALGGGLLFYGVKRGSRDGIVLSLLGTGLIYHGTSGHSTLYEVAGIDTARGLPRPATTVRHGRGAKFESSVIINKPAEELYRFWRKFENLPRFMSDLGSVKSYNDRRSHWTVKALAETKYEWDAEIINEIPNELLAWRTLEGADLDHAGSVRFEKAPGGRGTKVKVTLEYRPPGGKIGVGLAKVFGQEPEQIIQRDLLRFKQLMEAGEIATVEGQPSSRRSGM